MKKPKVLENIDLEELIEMTEKHLKNIEEESDDDHYIYEKVMETIYGKTVWDYINDKI